MNGAPQRFKASIALPLWVAERMISSWRALRPQHVAAALALAILNFLVGIGVTLRNPEVAAYLPAYVLQCCLSGVCLMLAIVAADDLVGHGAPRLASYALAVTAAAVAGSVVCWYLVQALGWRNWFHAGQPIGLQRTQMAFQVFYSLTYNGLGTAAYLHWRDTQAATRRLRESELGRTRDARRLQQTRLAALQARVDPELLFSALRQVAALQKLDKSAADALLTDLITLLRGLMPTGQAAASTVGHEFALAVSYLRVVACAASAPTAPTVEFSIGPDASDACIAPMLLLPLLKSTLATHRSGVPRLHVRADALAGELRISISVPGRDGAEFAADSPDWQPLRDRLADLHGTTARLVTGPRPDLRATLYVPLEYDDRADR